MAVNAHDLVSLCDEKTIAVVGILGNHYNGMYDPIWDIDEEIEKLNAEKAAAAAFIVAKFLFFNSVLVVKLDFSSSWHRLGLANWDPCRWCEWRLHRAISRDEWK
eukprot:scaffold25270_cov58-Skeletonema_marinoi.AAC.1